jgi:hypothetical protein
VPHRRVVNDPDARYTTTCCARAATGQAAAPPSSVMNARLFNGNISREDTTPRERGRPTALRDFQRPEGRYGSKSVFAVLSAA